MNASLLLKVKEGLQKNDKIVVTKADGSRRVETIDGSVSEVLHQSPGFVVDTKPDEKLHQVIPGLFIGSQDAPLNTKEIIGQKVAHILSLIDINLNDTRITHTKMPLLDIDTFDLSDYLAKSSEIIDGALSKGQHILVHCNAGVSRAPSIVIAYLILKRGMSYDEAFNLVKAARPCIKPNEGFVKQLRALR
ncbi:hypothetical protein MP638_000701 [Amoeboaphelidium occidentale]|nr:hypothetical protein MP638_000701 [Amoeboaphelidium occidentale]